MWCELEAGGKYTNDRVILPAQIQSFTQHASSSAEPPFPSWICHQDELRPTWHFIFGPEVAAQNRMHPECLKKAGAHTPCLSWLYTHGCLQQESSASRTSTKKKTLFDTLNPACRTLLSDCCPKHPTQKQLRLPVPTSRVLDRSFLSLWPSIFPLVCSMRLATR